MWVRISAAVATLALVLLLVLVGRDTFFTPRAMVLPLGGVSDRGAQDDLPSGPLMTGQLQERTGLQRWRAETGPAPGIPATGRLELDPKVRSEGAAAPDPSASVAGWLAQPDRHWTLLQTPQFQRGEVNLPSERADVLVQPQGRDWRRRHEETLFHAGGWIIFGTGLLLALFLLLRGRIPLEKGFSGRLIQRFPPLERANHWMTAVSFIALAVTGSVILYGRHFVKPMTGADLYGDIAGASLYMHVAFALPFFFGILAMAAFWLRQNLPDRTDLRWLGKFGGFLSNDPVKPPAHRFNAGQKIVFWGVVGLGLLLFLSGLGLLFPFYWTDVIGMQWALVVHAGLALLLMALIIGHIYIGTVGMVGAFDAMWSGQVDRNWLEEHHRLWLAELEGNRPEDLGRRTHVRRRDDRRRGTSPAAAE